MAAAPATPSDDVERLFRRLVANLAALDPSRLSRPFPVADITRSLVPYRTHRAVLRFETSEDYEMAVLRLIAGDGGFAALEPGEAAEAAQQEAASPNPDTALIRRIGTATVSLDPERVADALAGKRSAAEPSRPAPPPAPEPEDDNPVVSIFARSEQAPAPEEHEEDPLPFTLAEEPEEEAPVIAPRAVGPGSGCPYCGGDLPVGRTVLFCPHCGQNVGVVHCPTCDSELDVGWQFCITCGQRVSGGL